ncbi:MAG: hypothetical protein ABSA78_16765 [Candidatus Sulfotelmatobacter sp.]|jgi:hypothetical protein
MIPGLNQRLLSWSAAWSAAWRGYSAGLAPRCGYLECVHAGSLWHRVRRRSRGVRLQGARYCQTECLELALTEVFAQTRPVARRGAGSAAHRIPLGLHLLSRQQITAGQLRTALEAQRAAEGTGEGKKKIGGWLQELGFASEQQVTAALARQWSCPVLRAGAEQIGAGRVPAIPVLLLESFQMIPVELVEATGTLLMAFSDGIDYTVLYSIERMLGCRTDACLVCPSTLQQSLQTLARRRGSSDIVFDRVQNAGECIRIIGNYSANVRAQEVRLARCGEHLWVRLERLRQETVNLVLRLPANISSQFSVLSSRFSVTSPV